MVLQGNYSNFSQDSDLRRRLLETGDRELVQASPQDRTWGTGYAAKFAEMRRTEWGSNLLGKALMSVRERLRAEEREESVSNTDEQVARE